MRRKRKWTEEETELFLKGIETFGISNWVSIQKKFLPERTNVMIKDRYRSMMNSKDDKDRILVTSALNTFKKKQLKRK